MTTTALPEPANQLKRWLGFLEYDPANTHLLNNIFQTALEINDTDTINRILAHLQVHNINEPQLNSQACLLSLQLGHCQQAIDFGLKALGTEQENPILLHNIAYAYLYIGEYEKSQAILQPLIQSAVDITPDTYVLYARVVHQLEQPEEAMAVLEKAISLNPQHAEALGILALLQYETNSNISDNLNARVTAKKALKIQPYQLEALLALAEIQLTARQVEPARESFNLLLEHHPQSGRGWSGLGQLEFYETNFEQAEAYSLKAIECMYSHVGTWHVLGWIYILRGDADRAQWALEKALPLNTKFADTYGGLAAVEAMRGNTLKAEQLIQRAYALDEHSMAAIFAEHVLLNNAGEPEAAQQKMHTMLLRRAPSSDKTGVTLVNEWLVAHPDFKDRLNNRRPS
jgi:tetratricopeptide (TPR) repeat protein